MNEFTEEHHQRIRRLAFVVDVARALPDATFELVWNDHRHHHLVRVNGIIHDTDIVQSWQARDRARSKK